MAYYVYLGGVELPVPPERIELTVNGKNETVELADGTEINLVQTPGLSDVAFTALLPAMPYHFAPHAQKPAYYMAALERFMTGKQPFQFVVTRGLPSGGRLHSTNLTVTLEHYTVTDDAGEGFDTTVKIALRQFRPYETGLVPVTQNADGTYTAQAAGRPDTRQTPVSYTVQPGDTLPNIALRMFGDTAKYTALLAGNGLTDPLRPAVGEVLRL